MEGSLRGGFKGKQEVRAVKLRNTSRSQTLKFPGRRWAVHGNQEAMSDGQAMMVPNGIIGENEDALTKDQKICMEITNTAGYQMDFKKEDIVERFARADKARSTEGNGLGLAIVSTYAAALGGEFDIFIDYDQFKARLVFPREMVVEWPEAEA